jgi:tripartite-type tricarboxylate transporter receptor subunit TctC
MHRTSAATLLCSAIWTIGVQAADYPQHPVRMIVPFSPGGTSDTLARILGQKMTETWGQQVVVDTRPGASGIIGTEIAAHAPADGYTLLHGNLSQFATNPYLYKIPYDTFRDFVPLTQVGTAPQLLVVNPSLPVKSVRELIQLARSKPGALNFGSGGAGTLAYLGGEMFRLQANVKIVHVPYKGTVLALNDVVAGAVQILFSDMPIALPHAKSGKLRAIAVTGAKRTPLFPEMRTVAESGVPGYALDNWWGILAPRATPHDITAKLAAEIMRIHTLQEVRERYATLGVEARSTTPEQFAAYIKSEAAKFSKVIRESGAKVE